MDNEIKGKACISWINMWV